MESWRMVFREGLVPILTKKQMLVLKQALIEDSYELTQGSTTTPPPLMCVADFQCEAACLLGYCAWKSDDLHTVGEVEEAFARMCFEVDQRLGEPAAIRWLLNWYDDTPRDEMRKELLKEIELALERKVAA